MHRWTRTAVVTIAVAAIAAAVRSRANRPVRVVFFRPFSMDPMETANSRRSRETQMANILQLRPSARWTLNGVSASMRAIARTLIAEHTRALDAARKADLPRQRMAEVRAMYLSASHSQEGNGTAPCAKSARQPQADTEPPRNAVARKATVADPRFKAERLT